MKHCHICNTFHNHTYCPLCGAFCYVINGERKAINRSHIEMVAALGKMSPVMRYARKIQHNVPVSAGQVRISR